MARRYRFVPPGRGLATHSVRLGRALGRSRQSAAMASRTVDLRATPGYRGSGSISGRTVERGAAAEAWALYKSGTLPELKYLVFHLGNALSQCRLVASDIDPDTGMPTGSVDMSTPGGRLAAKIAHDIAGGPAGQAQMLRSAAGKLTISGRVTIAVIHERGLDSSGQPITERWLTLSDSEVTEGTDGHTKVLTPEGTWYQLRQPMDSLHVVWTPHEEFASQSDSLVMGSLDLLNEISLYGQIINARIRNALLLNGIVRLPSSLTVSVPAVHPAAAGNPAGSDVYNAQATPQSLSELIALQAVAASDDPASLEASMPIIVQDGDADTDKHVPIEVTDISVGTTTDFVDRRAAAIQRWIGVTDIPREAIEGYGSSNRWNAWYTGEQFITMHIRPIGGTLTDGLTTRLYRDTLRAEGHPDPESVTLWVDTSRLAAKPDQSAAAKDAVDRGAISRSAYRKYSAFTEDDDWDLTTPEGQRDFARWVVAKNETMLGDPTIAEWFGLPAPITIERVRSRANTAVADDAAAGDIRSTPVTRDASASIRTLNSRRPAG